MLILHYLYVIKKWDPLNQKEIGIIKKIKHNGQLCFCFPISLWINRVLRDKGLLSEK